MLYLGYCLVPSQPTDLLYGDVLQLLVQFLTRFMSSTSDNTHSLLMKCLKVSSMKQNGRACPRLRHGWAAWYGTWFETPYLHLTQRDGLLCTCGVYYSISVLVRCVFTKLISAVITIHSVCFLCQRDFWELEWHFSRPKETQVEKKKAVLFFWCFQSWFSRDVHRAATNDLRI